MRCFLSKIKIRLNRIEAELADFECIVYSHDVNYCSPAFAILFLVLNSHLHDLNSSVFMPLVLYGPNTLQKLVLAVCSACMVTIIVTYDRRTLAPCQSVESR